MYTRPQEPVKKPIRWGLIALILLAGFVAIGAVCAFAGYQLFQTSKQTPKARKGFGKPEKIATLDGGWARYRFPEVPMEMELPGVPKPDNLQFDTGSIFFTENWIYYGIESEVNWIEIVGHWYLSQDSVDLEYEAEYAKEWAELSQQATGVKTEVRDATFGKLTGKEVVGSGMSDGDKLTFRFFYWTQGKAVFSIHTYAWQDYQKEGAAELERMVKSVKLD